MLLILLMTEDSFERVQQVIAEGMLPRLVGLVEDSALLAKSSGIPFNAMRILNSIAQDSPDHLQQVLAAKPLAAVLKVLTSHANHTQHLTKHYRRFQQIAVHRDADDYVHSQVTNILCTLSAAVDIGPFAPAGKSIFEVLWVFLRYSAASNGTIVAQGCEILHNTLKFQGPQLSAQDAAFVCGGTECILRVLTSSLGSANTSQTLQLHATRAITALLGKLTVEAARSVMVDHGLVTKVCSQLKSLNGARSAVGKMMIN